MSSERPFLFIFYLHLCLVIHSVCPHDEVTEGVSLVSEENHLLDPQQKEKVDISVSKDENEIANLINPSATTTSSKAEDSTTTSPTLSLTPTKVITGEDESGHGKQTMTVTAVRLGSSRYFHPGSFKFDSERHEYPHSVIFPVTAPESDNSKPPEPLFKMEESPTFTFPEFPPTMPSLDYDHEPQTPSSFDDYPDQEHDSYHPPIASDPLDLTGFSSEIEPREELPNMKSEELKELSSSEVQDLSLELNRVFPQKNISEDPMGKIRGAPTVPFDDWPIDLTNKTDGMDFVDFPSKNVVASMNSTPQPFLRLPEDENFPMFGDSNEHVDDLLNYFEEGNELPEPLPNPVALVAGSPDDNHKREELQEEFAEALKKVEPRPRQRRPGPGTKRKVRMRVRKINTAEPNQNFKSFVQSSPINSFNIGLTQNSSSNSEANTKPPVRIRYRSTTTTPSPDPPPPTISSTKFEQTTTQSILIAEEQRSSPIVIKNGPPPIILQKGNMGRDQELEAEKSSVSPPQIEKPSNGAFTEKMNSFFFPSTISSNYPRVEKTEVEEEGGKFTNDSGVEWLQSANSKHLDVHHDDEMYFQDRDNWEKNYMNLQQNSFYGVSPESLEDQKQHESKTLADLNREHHENEDRMLTNRDGNPGLSEHLMKEHREIPQHQNIPSNMEVHTVNIPQNEPGATVTFNSPKIVYVEPRPPTQGHTETPEIAIIQRPPESQGTPESTHQYSHLERPLVPFHMAEEYQVMNHPDLSAPTSSEPQFQPEHHYDRTKYEFVEHPGGGEFQSGETESKPTPPTIIMARDPAPQSVFSGFQISDQKQQEIQPHNPPPQPQIFPQKTSRPFGSDEFLGFGNDKHLLPDQVPSSRAPKSSQDFDKIGSGLQKDSSNSFNSNYAFGKSGPISNGETYHYQSEQEFQKRNPFEKYQNSNLGIPTLSQQSPYSHPFPRDYSSNGGIQEIPAPNGVSPSRSNQGHGQASTNQQNSFSPYAQQYDLKNGNKYDSFKSSDFSGNYPNAGFYNQRPPGVSPTITLPMPGLVSVPTPPPDQKAMHEVTPNRHFPPHTHSMASRPDYEPANPPLPNGHPMQHHFDPFVQNAGDFPNEDSQKSHQQHHGNSLNSNFKNYIGPTQGSFSGSSNYVYPQPNAERPPAPYEFDNDPQTYSGTSGKRRPNKSPANFRPNTFLAEVGLDDEKQKHLSGSQTNFDTSQEHNDESGGHQTTFLDHEGESQESPKDEKLSKPAPTTPSPYSDKPYVLMFPNSQSEIPLNFPIPHKVKQTQFSSTDPAALGSEVKHAMGYVPGYQAVPVHPRDQMLQVLASTHYENLLHEYMEQKKRPKSNIYTPYGVLVPVGPTAVASTVDSESHYGHSGHSSVPGIAPGQKGLSFNLQSPLLNTHTNFGINHGRVAASFGLKATVEPALEVLAEKVALKLSALEYLLRHPQKHVSSYPGVEEPTHQNHQNHHHITNPQGSYSEQRSTKTALSEQPSHEPKQAVKVYVKPPKGKSKILEDKESNENFKLYIKELLKERLYEMLNEMDESESIQKKTTVKSPGGGSNARVHRPLPSSPPLPQLEDPNFPGSLPMSSSMLPINHSRNKPQETGGILQSIKRFFTFGGRQSNQPQENTHFPIPLPMGSNPLPNFNFTRPHEKNDKLSQHRFKHKTGTPNTDEGKLNAKDIEKILAIILKSDKGDKPKETRAFLQKRKSDDIEVTSDEGFTGQVEKWIPPRFQKQQVKKFTLHDAFEPTGSASSHRPMGIRMVAPPRYNGLNSLENNRRNFINSKIDKGHWRMPRSQKSKPSKVSRVPSSNHEDSSKFKPMP